IPTHLKRVWANTSEQPGVALDVCTTSHQMMDVAFIDDGIYPVASVSRTDMPLVIRNPQSCIVKPHGIYDQLTGPHDSISEQFFISTPTPFVVILFDLNPSVSGNR